MRDFKTPVSDDNEYFDIHGARLPNGTRLSRSLAGVTTYLDEIGCVVGVAYETKELAAYWKQRQDDAEKQANMGIKAGPQ